MALVGLVVSDPPVLYSKFSGLFNTFLIDKKFSKATLQYKIMVLAQLSLYNQIFFLFDLQFCKKSQDLRELFFIYANKFLNMVSKYLQSDGLPLKTHDE